MNSETQALQHSTNVTYTFQIPRERSRDRGASGCRTRSVARRTTLGGRQKKTLHGRGKHSQCTNCNHVRSLGGADCKALKAPLPVFRGFLGIPFWPPSRKNSFTILQKSGPTEKRSAQATRTEQLRRLRSLRSLRRYMPVPAYVCMPA